MQWNFPHERSLTNGKRKAKVSIVSPAVGKLRNNQLGGFVNSRFVFLYEIQFLSYVLPLERYPLNLYDYVFLAISSPVNLMFCIPTLADIRQMGAGRTDNLPRSEVSDKPKPLRQTVDDSEGADTRPSVVNCELSTIEAHLSCEFERTHDPRAPYAVDNMDGGRNSAMWRWRRKLIARAF